MIKFAEPSVDDLFVALSEAISMTRRVIPNELHQRIVVMYSWMDVSERTERIYNDMAVTAFPSLASRFLRYLLLIIGAPFIYDVSAPLSPDISRWGLWQEWQHVH